MWFHPLAMRDLRIYGKKRLLGVFRAWSKKQIGVKARAGRISLINGKKIASYALTLNWN
jgi:hypothetical protein